MKKEVTKKLAVLLVGMPLASASVLAGELGSLTNEVKINDYDGGYQKTEWTVAKGSYKLNDDFKFLFDVDKDFVENADGTKKQGWDTQFGLSQKLGQVAGFDLSLYYLMRYDASWNADNGSEDKYSAQYIFSPVFSKDITLAGKEFSLTTELWAQVGEAEGGSLQDKSGVETNFYLDGSLSDNWDLNLAWYNFNYYNSTEDEYDYTIGTEDYLTYSMPLGSGFTFAVENYIYAEVQPANDDSEYVEAWVRPMVKYSKKVNDNFSWNAGVSYDVVEYRYSAAGTTWDNNEMEVKLGFTIR